MDWPNISLGLWFRLYIFRRNAREVMLGPSHCTISRGAWHQMPWKWWTELGSIFVSYSYPPVFSSHWFLLHLLAVFTALFKKKKVFPSYQFIYNLLLYINRNVHLYFIQLFKTSYCIMFFNVQIIPDLSSGSPFRLSYVTIFLGALPHFRRNQMFQAGLYSPSPRLKSVFSPWFNFMGNSIWKPTAEHSYHWFEVLSSDRAREIFLKIAYVHTQSIYFIF